ncbi:MAG: lipid asymmetry maintenance protein MlaB [Gammaproteobacteria bacterium]
MYRFPAAVTFANANEALEHAAAAETGTERLYDLSACQRFDSSLIAVLLELERRAQARASSCRYEGAPDKLLELGGLYGVDPLLFSPPAVSS